MKLLPLVQKFITHDGAESHTKLKKHALDSDLSQHHQHVLDET